MSISSAKDPASKSAQPLKIAIGRGSVNSKTFIAMVFSLRTTQPSFCSATVFDFGSMYEHRTGVIVSETTRDARIDTIYATPSGRKSLPSMPPKAKRGKNTKTTMIVERTIELLTSTEAS
ncbi:hypothetical protein D3C72_1929710 [compost metagenome]